MLFAMFCSLSEIPRKVLQLAKVNLKWQKLIWQRKNLLAVQKRPGIWGQWMGSVMAKLIRKYWYLVVPVSWRQKHLG